jgi:hypothetical protein
MIPEEIAPKINITPLHPSFQIAYNLLDSGLRDQTFRIEMDMADSGIPLHLNFSIITSAPLFPDNSMAPKVGPIRGRP